MAMNNATNILSEFVQVLSTLIKSKGAYIVILSVDEQLKPDLREMLSLVSDQIVTIMIVNYQFNDILSAADLLEIEYMDGVILTK